MASHERLVPDQLVQEAGGQVAAFYLHRALDAGRHIELLASHCSQYLEDLAVAFPIQIVTGRHGISIAAGSGPDHHQLIRLRIRKWREQRRVKNAEDGGVRANAQRERQDRHRRKSRIFSQQTKTKAGVTQEVCHAGALLLRPRKSDKPGQGYDSSDCRIPTNPARSHIAPHQSRNQANPTSRPHFLPEKSREMRLARLALWGGPKLEIRPNAIIRELCMRVSCRQTW